MTNPATVGICIALNELIEHIEQVVWETVTAIAEIAGLNVIKSKNLTLKVIVPDEVSAQEAQ